MASPEGDNEGRPPGFRFRLSDLPSGVRASDIETCLYATCEDITDVEVTVLGGGKASVTVQGVLDVEGFVKKKHRLGRDPFRVEIDQHPSASTPSSSLPILADTIEVTGDLPDFEMLTFYFEGVKSGGGEDKEVETIKAIREGVVHVKFSTKEDAALVVGQESHSICGKVLKVCYVPDPSAKGGKQVDGTSPKPSGVHQPLLISSIPDDVHKDCLVNFVENRLGLDHEKDFTLNFQPPHAYLKFSCERDIEDMAKKLMSKKLKNHRLVVEQALSTTLEEKETSELAVKKLLISGIPDGVEPPMLELFIDGTLGVESQKDYTLETKFPKAEVLLSSTHLEKEVEFMCQKLMSKPLKGQKLTVEQVHEVPMAIDPRKLLISDIPSSVCKDFLVLFIESKLKVNAQDYSLTVCSPKALVTFTRDHSKKELEQKCLILMSNPLQDQKLTVELCEENRSIIVQNIMKSLHSHEVLDMYFNTSSLSGGGAVEAVKLMGLDAALITFMDAQVVLSVLSHDHSRLGSDVSIVARTPLDDFDSEPHQQQSRLDNEDIFHDASSEPSPLTEPLTIKVDPLIAKYLTKNSSIVATPLESMSLSVQIDESNNAIVVSPSPLSPGEWPEKSKQIVDEVLLNSVAQEVFPILPEAASLVYPTIMKFTKSCKEGELLYDINDTCTRVTIAGDSGRVSALKKQIDDLCTRFIKKSDNIPLSEEDFAFLSAFQSAGFARYPDVEIQCHPNNHSVSLHGPVKFVEAVKEQLPQILAHSKISVPLHPLAVHFLHGGYGRKRLEGIVQHASVVPFFESAQQEDGGNKSILSLSFLSSADNATCAEALATSITNDVKLEALPLPKSFHSKVSTSPDFENFKKKMHKQYSFVVNVKDEQLLVVSTAEQIQVVVNYFVHHIKEECSVTKTIFLKRGVWRLFHSSAAIHKWESVKAAMKEREIQLLQVTKANAPKSSITIKGESEAVEDIERDILHFQASVQTKEIPVSRPGISKYLFKEAYGRMVIGGVESRAKVCIELDVKEEGPAEDDLASGAQQKLTKVCWGSTSEMKTISVYVGDITEFNKAEVIVNAANEDLKHIGGVAYGIAKKGGPVIQKDSDDYIRQRGKVATGNAVLFQRVGDLLPPYKAIVHTVGPRWEYGKPKDRQIALLKKAVRNALIKAKDYNSIALPAISTGIYSFPLDLSAVALIDAAVDFSKKEPQTPLNEINIIAFSRKDAEEFQKALKSNALKTFFSEGQSAASLTSKETTTTDITPDTSSRKRRKTRSFGGVAVQSAPLTSPTSPVAVAFASSPATRQAALDCIKVSNGSILDFHCDALVNTTDQNLGFGGYVSQALLKAAGDTLKDECAKKKPIAMGGVTITGAGNLKCKHIIHTVLPGYDGPSGTAEKTLKSVVVQCLQHCTQLNLKSVAIPSIGAGNLKYPDDVVAQCLLEETLHYLEANHGKTSLQLVHFVVFMPRTFDAFKEHHLTLASGRAKEDEGKDSAISSQPLKNITPSRASGRPSYKASQLSNEGVCRFSLANDLVLEVVLGDISDDSSDVIVNPTSTNLVLVATGVQGAILRKGGQELQDLCTALSKGHNCLTEGKVIETPSCGRLRCESVYHIHYSSNDRKKFIKTVLACLEKANSTKRRSIAFPAIGTGMNKYSVSEAADGMVRALKKFVEKCKTKHLQVVRVVLFQEDVHQEFVQAFQTIGEDKEEGFLQAIVRGCKAFGSYLLSGYEDDPMSNNSTNQKKEPVDTIGLEMAETSVDEEWVLVPPNLSIHDTVVLTIYGMTEQSVEMAEKNLRSAIDTFIVTEEIDDSRICQLSVQTIQSLDKEAKDHHVQIEIDQEEALHTVSLTGCQADVFTVKDKVRDALAALSKEKTEADAADAVFATIRWTRLLSGEETDDYDPLINYEIEQAYKRKQGTHEFKNEAENFVVDFTNFQEKDCITLATVEIKRRDLIKEYSSESKPDQWDSMPTDSSGKESRAHLVTLQTVSEEYQEVESKFRATMGKATLFSIERVQNPVLYGQYINLKKQMDKRNPSGHQNERWLFHGTSPDTCSKINTQGFNRSFMGKNGTAYGNGVYFAVDARYSNGYASPDVQGKRRMYLTRVLCGEYTIGNSGMIVPPAKNFQQDPNVLFDSTVNNTSNPSIFVVYNDSQNYPAYLITYS